MNKFNSITLSVKCPFCSKSFMDENHKVNNHPGIKLSVNSDGVDGNIWLSSIYGDYKHESDISISEKTVVTFSCPSCKAILNTKEICSVCDASMVSLVLDMGGKVSFCSRKGCDKHLVGFEDLSEALQKFYQNFDLGK